MERCLTVDGDEALRKLSYAYSKDSASEIGISMDISKLEFTFSAALTESSPKKLDYS